MYLYLFIEYQFLEDFCILHEGEIEKRPGYKLLSKILNELTEKKVYINLKNHIEWEKKVKEFEELYLLDNSTEKIVFCKDLEKEMSSYDLEFPAFALMSKSKTDNSDAYKSNLPVLDIESFEQTLIDLDETGEEFELDVTDSDDEDFWPGWNCLKKLNIYANNIKIVDNYLLDFGKLYELLKKDKKNDVVKKLSQISYKDVSNTLDTEHLNNNLVKMVKPFFGGDKSIKKNLIIYVDLMKTDPVKVEYNDPYLVGLILRMHSFKIKAALSKLNSVFANYNLKIEIYNTSYIEPTNKRLDTVKIHDRRCYSNYNIVHSTPGFMLYKKGDRFLTDGEFKIETILNKKVFNRWKRNYKRLNSFHNP